MRLPSPDAWLFSIKTYAAAMLALFTVLSLDLARPSWAVATVFVASQPLSGATRSKSLYRVLGTLIGAAATVALVPNLVQAPELLSLAMASWVAACLYLSLQDRTPRSYVFMLAGYSAALIGFPAVDAPQAVFDTALARVEEITVGIACSTLVHSLVLPRSVGHAILQRIDTWIADSRRWSAEALAGPGQTGPGQTADPAALRQRLAGYAVEVDMLAAHLAYDTSELRGAAPAIQALHRRMALLLPILSSIGDRLVLLRRHDAAGADGIERLLARVRAWLREEATAPSTDALREEIDAAEPAITTRSDWGDILRSGLLIRLRELLNTFQACRHLRRQLAGDAPGRRRTPRREGFRVDRHVDQGLALLSAGTAFVAVLASCAIWVATGWPDGSSVPMIAAVSCSFFATFDNPLPPMAMFLKYAVVAVVLSLIYSSALLPLATSFEVAALMLAPPFLVLGLLIASPATSFIGMVLAANMATLVGLQNRFVSDFLPSVNGAVALVVGLGVASVLTAILRARTADWSARRILRAGWRDLLATIRGGGRGVLRQAEREAFAHRMLDRLYVLMPRLAAISAQGGSVQTDTLPELRLGANIIDLQMLRRHLPGAVDARVAPVMDGIADHLDALSRHGSAAPPAALLLHVDEALAAVAATAPLRRKREFLLALAGLRIVLFPEAPPYRAPGMPAPARLELPEVA